MKTLFDDIYPEVIPIIGQGKLYNLSYDDEDVMEEPVPKDVVIYDRKLDQYCVNGQWIIPYHREEKIKDYKLFFDRIIKDILKIKNDLVLNQKFESASMIRDLERTMEKSFERILEYITKEGN